MDYEQSVLYNEFTIDYLQWLQSRCSMDLIVCTNYSIDTIYFEDSLLNWLWTKPMEYVHWLYSHLLTTYSRYGTTSIWWTIYNDCNVAAQLTACTNCSIDTIYFDDSLLNWLRKIPVEYMTLLSSIDYVHSVWNNEYKMDYLQCLQIWLCARTAQLNIYFEDSLLDWSCTKPIEYVQGLHSEYV